MLNYQFAGYDIINSKDGRKFLKMVFIIERSEDVNHQGYDCLSEIIPFNKKYLELFGQNVRLIYTKNFRGMAQLQDIEAISGKEN